MKISFRDIRIAYIGQSPAYSPTGGFSSNPDAPYNSQESNYFKGLSNSNPFCPKCDNHTPLLIINKKQTQCPKCNTRFSLTDFQVGGSNSRETGLLNMDNGSNSYPQAHDASGIGSGSASTEWGKS